MQEIKTKIYAADLADAMDRLHTFTTSEMKAELELLMGSKLSVDTVRRRLNYINSKIDPETNAPAIAKNNIGGVVYFSATKEQIFKIRHNADFLKRAKVKSKGKAITKKMVKGKICLKWGDRLRGVPGDTVLMLGC